MKGQNFPEVFCFKIIFKIDMHEFSDRFHSGHFMKKCAKEKNVYIG